MRGKLGKLTSLKNPVIFKISDRTKVANCMVFRCLTILWQLNCRGGWVLFSAIYESGVKIRFCEALPFHAEYMDDFQNNVTFGTYC
jgi:hypothetical protein